MSIGAAVSLVVFSFRGVFSGFSVGVGWRGTK